jgi:hypothetical protein
MLSIFLISLSTLNIIYTFFAALLILAICCIHAINGGFGICPVYGDHGWIYCSHCEKAKETTKKENT